MPHSNTVISPALSESEGIEVALSHFSYQNDATVSGPSFATALFTARLKLRWAMLFRFFRIVVAVSFLATIPQVSFAQQKDPCTLPSGLQRVVAHEFPGAKLITLSNLNEDHKKFYVKDHGNDCPGLTKVDFYGDGNPTWAMALS